MENTNENFRRAFNQDDHNYYTNQQNSNYENIPGSIIIGKAIPQELWTPIVKTPTIDVELNRYYVSTYGNVWDTKANNFSSMHTHQKTGYVSVHLSCGNGKGISVLVHRLVMISFCYFIGCEQYQVNHKDTYRDHNWIWNLEWVTYLENMQYAYIEGNAHKNPNLTMTEEKVRLICEELCKKTSYEEILNKLGIYKENFSPVEYHNLECLIYCIKYKKAWKYISDQYDIPEDDNRRVLSTQEVELVCQCIQQGISYDEILVILGYDYLEGADRRNMKGLFSSIRQGKVYKDISSKYNLTVETKRMFTDEEVHFICKCIQEGVKFDDILDRLGYQDVQGAKRLSMRATLSNIKTRKNYTEISCNYNF